MDIFFILDVMFLIGKIISYQQGGPVFSGAGDIPFHNSKAVSSSYNALNGCQYFTPEFLLQKPRNL